MPTDETQARIIEQPNEFAAIAAAVVRRPNSGLHDKDIAVGLVAAVLALAEEVAALREQLADDLSPTGALAGFLDEIGVRIAPDGDSVAEAIVSLRRGEPQ